MFFSKIFSMGLMVLGASALALPAASNSTVAAPAPTAMANINMLSYYGDSGESCNSPYSQSSQTISSNTCIDLGMANTTKSVLFTDLVESASTKFCKIQVWKDETCCGVETEVRQLEEKTCVDFHWKDGSFGMGSLMLVCS